MITGNDAVTIEDVTGKLFLRETVASGEYNGRPVEVTIPVGGASLLFEAPEHEGKPRVQWLVKCDAEAIFTAMLGE